MPALIVNADDFGAGSETDQGILDAFRGGGVSSASLLTTGVNSGPAAAAALKVGLPLGVHLNLAEGFPLSGPLPGLTGADGRFPGKKQLRAALQQERVALRDLQRELRAQIERAWTLGVTPDHLDTHQHFFLFPGPRKLIIDLAREYQIPALRLPCPAEPAADDPGGNLGAELQLYRRLAPATFRAVKKSGLHTPEGLFGMPWLNRLGPETLAKCLTQIPAGRWELMVHPGYPDLNNPFSGPARQIELTSLIAAETRQLFQHHKLQLITFAELI